MKQVPSISDLLVNLVVQRVGAPGCACCEDQQKSWGMCLNFPSAAPAVTFWLLGLGGAMACVQR